MTNLCLCAVKDKFPSATHIRILINPFHFRSGPTMKFGIEPTPTEVLQYMTLYTFIYTGIIAILLCCLLICISLQGGYLLGVDDSHNSCAHLSGVTIRDIVLMYATMNSKECKFPGTNFRSDISKAQNDGKHLILVLKREDYVY